MILIYAFIQNRGHINVATVSIFFFSLFLFFFFFRRDSGSGSIQKEDVRPNSCIGSRNTRTSWTARAVAATAVVRRGAVAHTPQPMGKALHWATNTVRHPCRHPCTLPRGLPQIPHQSAIRPPKVRHYHFLCTLNILVSLFTSGFVCIYLVN